MVSSSGITRRTLLHKAVQFMKTIAEKYKDDAVAKECVYSLRDSMLAEQGIKVPRAGKATTTTKPNTTSADHTRRSTVYHVRCQEFVQ